MFRKIFIIIMLSISSHYASSVCLEEEVEIADRCIDRKKIHDVQSINRLQSLIDEAKEGEYIFFKSGTYEINSFQDTALLVTGKKSLTLLGEDDTVIKTKREDQPVLTIESSQEITIINLIFTHDTQNRYESPVMKLMNVKDVKILDTILEGPGTQAIAISNSDNVEMRGGRAIKNSEGVFDIKDSKNITIRNMVIEDNHNLGELKKGILDIENAHGIFFSYNIIKNNKNDYFKKVVHSQNLEIEGNEFKDNGFSNYDIHDITQQEAKAGKVLWSENVMIHPQLPHFKVEFMGTLKDKIANIKFINLYQVVDKQEQMIQSIENLDTYTIPDDQDRYFRIEDVNFDDYQDIFLMNSVKGEDSIYLFWLFNRTEKRFIQNDELSGIPNPIIDHHKKQILSAWKNSPTNSGMNYYEFVDGQATLVRQELKDALKTGGYQWTVKERQENEMKMIEQQWVKEEHAPELIQQIWQQLGKISDHDASCVHEKNEIRFLYCHLKEVVNYSRLETLAKLPIFVQGPHKEAQLNLESKDDFGYYNKEFLTWLKEKWESASQDKHFKTWTEPVYRHNIQKLARTFYEVALQLKNYPIDFEKEKRNYLADKKQHTSSHCCHYPWFRHSFVDYSPQTINLSIAFWIRRSIDGTDQEWQEGLRDLLETYDMEFLRKIDEQNLLRYQINRKHMASIAPHYCPYHPVILLSSSETLGYAHLKDALQQAHSGDVIWICPGTYYEPLHLEGRSHLVIYGDQAHLWFPSSSEPLITIKNSQSIEISGLHLSLEKIQEDSACLHLTDSHHINLRDLSIENCGRYGMWLSQVNEVEITGNQFNHNQEALTVQDSENIFLRYNRFIGNLQKNVSIPKKEDKEIEIFKNRWRDENDLHASLTEQNGLLTLKDLQNQANQGNPVSQLMLSSYWAYEDEEESFKWLFQAALQGYAKAQYQLGWRCHEGRRNCQAQYWFQEAAKQGHLKAQNLLARWYLEGKHITGNFAQAAFWARKAAQQGDAQAQNILAGLYYEGKGVPQDIHLATYWVTHAAQGGYSQAQNNLGQLYYQGIGTPRDFNQATYWFGQAAQQGHTTAQSYLKWMKEPVFIQ